ncbi:MAG: NAD(P)H-dependent oxidoreductase [Crocinitomicaceae bacterium]|nr:NAD(P)H-dependent oxidoreductase [Flavobacteriales bacterium]NQZ36417.1 NAD(P)H-dependent oxidoreductase [Crocinitomicaceae bacterium]
MRVLKINSSAAKEGSISRGQVDVIISKLLAVYPNAETIDRDLAYSSLPFLNDTFLEAILHRGELSEEQQNVTRLSDDLVNELLGSDILVLGAPMYNFGIPACLKAYFDLIARAGKTFQYSEQGYPIGLVVNKKAIVVITTGGVPLGSPMDFSKNYISTFLNFLGIKDVEFVELDENISKYEEKMKIANEKLDSILN